MKILDRYILKELIGPFFFGIVAFSAILVGSTLMFRLVGDVAKYHIPMSQALWLFVYQVPAVVAFSFPMSMLLASILAFGRLSSDLEIVALRSSGIGVFRICLPVIFFGFLMSGVTLWFNEVVVPRATTSAETLMESFTKSQQPNVKQNINFTEYDDAGFPKRIINVRRIEKGVFRDLTVVEYETGRLSRIVRAESGTYSRPESRWDFYKGVLHEFPADDRAKLMVMTFGHERINLRFDPGLFTQRTKYLDELSAVELVQRIRSMRKTGTDPTKEVIRFHMKFAVPFACLIFAILGASVGFRPHRSSSALGLGMSLVIIVAYYMLMSLGMALGLAHWLSPFFAAWIPNLVIGGAGLALLIRVGNR